MGNFTSVLALRFSGIGRCWLIGKMHWRTHNCSKSVSRSSTVRFRSTPKNTFAPAKNILAPHIGNICFHLATRIFPTSVVRSNPVSIYGRLRLKASTSAASWHSPKANFSNVQRFWVVSSWLRYLPPVVSKFGLWQQRPWFKWGAYLSTRRLHRQPPFANGYVLRAPFTPCGPGTDPFIPPAGCIRLPFFA